MPESLFVRDTALGLRSIKPGNGHGAPSTPGDEPLRDSLPFIQRREAGIPDTAAPRIGRTTLWNLR
jgi:hypothetical protein